MKFKIKTIEVIYPDCVVCITGSRRLLWSELWPALYLYQWRCFTLIVLSVLQGVQKVTMVRTVASAVYVPMEEPATMSVADVTVPRDGRDWPAKCVSDS